MKQLRLAAVIAVMRYRDLRGSPFLRSFVKSFISCSAAGFLFGTFFQNCPLPHIGFRQEKRDFMFSTQFFHIPGILTGFRPDPVIDMDHRNVQRDFSPPFQ